MVARRAPRALDELGRRAVAARASRSTTGAPATTSSRSPTTGTGARPRRPPGLLVLPGVELNCLLPGGPRRARARNRDRAGSGGARGRAARPRGDSGVDRRSRRRGVPRASLLDRRPARRLRAAGVRHRNRGLQRGLRARGRARTVVRPLGRAAPGRPLVSRARDRRQPPSGLRLRPRVDLAARGADGGKRARLRCGRAGSTAAPGR